MAWQWFHAIPDLQRGSHQAEAQRSPRSHQKKSDYFSPDNQFMFITAHQYAPFHFEWREFGVCGCVCVSASLTRFTFYHKIILKCDVNVPLSPDIQHNTGQRWPTFETDLFAISPECVQAHVLCARFGCLLLVNPLPLLWNISACSKTWPCTWNRLALNQGLSLP